jgi:dynein heavy chain
LQNAIKVANEAPQDLKSNLRRCFSKFDEKEFERAKSHKLNEYKALLFGLCMFHSLIVQPRLIKVNCFGLGKYSAVVANTEPFGVNVL